jgi:hypothetical protein
MAEAEHRKPAVKMLVVVPGQASGALLSHAASLRDWLMKPLRTPQKMNPPAITLRSAEIRIARRNHVTRKPERDQENQLTNQYVDPHIDLKKERPHVLIPSEEGNAVSLEQREESLSPASQQGSTRKEYGFRLLDPSTRKVVQEWQWLSTLEARDHVIRQSMSSGQFVIERQQRETPS